MCSEFAILRVSLKYLHHKISTFRSTIDNHNLTTSTRIQNVSTWCLSVIFLPPEFRIRTNGITKTFQLWYNLTFELEGKNRLVSDFRFYQEYINVEFWSDDCLCSKLHLTLRLRNDYQPIVHDFLLKDMPFSSIACSTYWLVVAMINWQFNKKTNSLLCETGGEALIIDNWNLTTTSIGWFYFTILCDEKYRSSKYCFNIQYNKILFCKKWIIFWI